MTKKNEIIIKGARLNNLKNISVNIPKNEIVVITGVSGSGKSTLAYDTIYAEAQRRYIESLSSYARQFLKNQNKPEVDQIKGLSPAIAIEQKTNINNIRSTVGTSTEIYYYLTLLYERIGKTFSPISGNEVKKSEFKDVKKYFIHDIDSYKIVFIDGKYSSHLSQTTHDGIDVCLMSAALTKPKYRLVIENYFNKIASKDSMSALNTAFSAVWPNKKQVGARLIKKQNCQPNNYFS